MSDQDHTFRIGSWFKATVTASSRMAARLILLGIAACVLMLIVLLAL